jgi:hypothetical protein
LVHGWGENRNEQTRRSYDSERGPQPERFRREADDWRTREKS